MAKTLFLYNRKNYVEKKKMKVEKGIEISNITKESLGLMKKKEITEEDISEQLEILKEFLMYPTIDVEDIDLISKYCDISEMRIKVRNENDLKKISELSDNSNLVIEIDIYDLNEVSEIPEYFEVDISIKNMSQLSLEKIAEIEKKCCLGQVVIDQESNGYGIIDEISQRLEKHYDMHIYKMLRREIDNIICGVDKKYTEVEKFLDIYTRLGNKINYDWEHELDIEDANYKFNWGGYPLSHNLIGGLLYNSCVCEGYAKILKQVLSCVGINSKLIIGNEENEKHAWNQVYIDGRWYNVDLTWDAERIKDGRELDYCLQSDEEFINHNTKSIIKEKCEVSYNRDKLNFYLGKEDDLSR